MVGLICHTKDRVGSLEILVSRELQTGSTGLAVEAVPEREVSCLTLELQTWLLQWAVALYWSWKILACRGSCKLGLLQLAVALVLWMEVLASRSGSTGLTVAAVLELLERAVLLIRSIQLLMGTVPLYDRHELLDVQSGTEGFFFVGSFGRST